MSKARSTPFSFTLPRSPKYIPPASSRTISMSRSPRRSGRSGEMLRSGFQQLSPAANSHTGRALPQIEQARFGPLSQRQRIPLRAAHRAQKHRIGFVASVQRFIGQRVPGLIDSRAANRQLDRLKLMLEFPRAFLENAGGPRASLPGRCHRPAEAQSSSSTSSWGPRSNRLLRNA